MTRLKPDFAPEWIALALVALFDFAWARVIGFHLTVTWSDGKLIAAGIAVMLALKVFAQPRFAKGCVMAEYFSLTSAAALVFAVLSYLALASSRALVDVPLMAADRALGFDWMAGYHFLKASPVIALILKFAYESMVYQGLYFCVLFALMDDRRNLREMFWLVLVAGLFTSIGVLLFPAFGPFKVLDMAPAGSFLPEMEHIKSGHDLNFALAKLTGVVSFPSFHTSMALAYVWGFRKTGPIFWAIAALNLLMLAAIPWYGGHYLTDMIAGGMVMAASLAVVKLAPRLFQPAPRLSPVTA